MNHAPRVHLICNAHLDPIWQWEWEEGLTEALATFEVACDLLDEYPEFIFNHNESLLYEWTRDHRPDLFRRIKRWVKTGRWVITGGWYVQPDCNLPCGESFIRQALIGLDFFEKEFGARPKVAYNFDPFGHHANMPQILRLAGFESYVHFRPVPGQLDLDDHLYRWRGVDGSEVLSMRPPCGWYNTPNSGGLRHKVGAMSALAKESGRDVTAFWGAGDHGGGATRDDLDALRETIAKDPDIVHASLEDYMSAENARDVKRPLVEGELQKCFVGCYTSVIGAKQRNRRGEGLALAAERWAALAWWLQGEAVPRKRLDSVWKRVLFNQFHDILPGSSVRRGYESSIELYGHAFTEAREIILKAQLALARSTQRCQSMPLLVFNPQAVRRRAPVEVECMAAPNPTLLVGRSLRVRDLRGRDVAFQTIASSSGFPEWQKRLLVETDAPAMGMAEYRIEVTEDPPLKDRPAVRSSRDGLLWRFTTDHYSLTINRRTGAITSLKARKSARSFSPQLISRPAGRLIVRADSNDAWEGRLPAYGKIVGRFRCPSKRDFADIVGAHDGEPCGDPVRVIEEGPVATRVEIVQSWGRSIARLRYTLFARHPQIGLEVLIDWNERRRALQLSFPMALGDGPYTTEIPHAAIQRPQGGGEEPCGRWTMLSSDDGAFAIVNDGPGGVDVKGGELRQTLVRSPMFCTMRADATPDRMGEHIDIGEHILRFLLRVGKPGDVRRDLPTLVDDLVMPPTAHIHIPLNAGDKEGLNPGQSVVEVSGGSGRLAALKQSDSGRGLIVRIVETAGRRTTSRLRLPGLDEPTKVRLGLYEIKTLRATRGKGGVKVTELKQLA